jgi:hypothetical protein
MRKQPEFLAIVMAVAVVVGFAKKSCAQAAAAAPTPDAAAAAATQPSGPPAFTDDFESGAIDKAKWDVRLNGSATATVQTTNSAHGKSALLVRYPARVRSYAFIVASHLPDTIKNHFFGRAYVLFPAAPPNAHDVFITAGGAGWPVSNFLEIGLRQNKMQLSYQQNGANITRAETMIAGPVYPVGKWFCLEWEFNDNPDHMNIWFDGKQVSDSKVAYQGNSANLIKGFTEFGFGFRSWGNVTSTFDVYYDDIAIGATRIGEIPGPVNTVAPTTAPAAAASAQ